MSNYLLQVDTTIIYTDQPYSLMFIKSSTHVNVSMVKFSDSILIVCHFMYLKLTNYSKTVIILRHTGISCVLCVIKVGGSFGVT